MLNQGWCSNGTIVTKQMTNK